MMISAPIACCIDMLSSGCCARKKKREVEGKHGAMARTHRQHSRLSRERAREESALFGYLRELVKGHKLEASAVLYAP